MSCHLHSHSIHFSTLSFPLSFVFDLFDLSFSLDPTKPSRVMRLMDWVAIGLGGKGGMGFKGGARVINTTLVASKSRPNS